MIGPELAAKIRDIKRDKDLTWKGIAAKIDPKASPIFITAALLGQMPLEPAQAKKAAKVLGLTATENDGEKFFKTICDRFKCSSESVFRRSVNVFDRFL